MAKPNPLVRAWKYASAWFGAKVDERADPKIQIEQAIQEAQRQHQALTQQAAAVIGNQRQLEMQLDRQLNSVENLQAQARQALVLAEKSRSEGDEAKAAQFEQAAQALANQLVSAVSASLQQMSDLAAPSNVPTLDEVRDKIEKRYAIALGQAELARGAANTHILEVQRATLDMKG